MPAPTTVDDFLQFARKSGQLDGTRLDDYLEKASEELPASPRKMAVRLIRAGVMTTFQAEQFLQGKHKGFRLGTYRIIDRLGTGGAGLVYLAKHEVLLKRFAIKVLPQACANDPGVLERFRREARAAAALDHPNVMQVYDFREEDGLSYLVMEYIEGPTLQRLLHRRERLDVPTACEYARQAALGLQHAHENGLVHRDVKPGNLMVDPTGTVKVLDLGLARYEAEAGEAGESLTHMFNSGSLLGTANDATPLALWIDSGTPLVLGADANVDGAGGVQYFFQGFVPALVAREIFIRGEYIRGRRMLFFLVLRYFPWLG